MHKRPSYVRPDTVNGVLYKLAAPLLPISGAAHPEIVNCVACYVIVAALLFVTHYVTDGLPAASMSGRGSSL